MRRLAKTERAYTRELSISPSEDRANSQSVSLS